ncbi:MAG: conjugal transfer protein [Mesorhizobium sp. 65-26]|uniref:conjugal transfer protein n=1 Tax=Mesorhizobium sp. 65-26 TaxID=1895781 RepID=UPI00095D66DD|nr:conjugal transfer protein [Mesorhizobium sp. 65-26]OJX77646.1 MAG: conjugal transfer protein [Mesorhizobium sp. 65-26]
MRRFLGVAAASALAPCLAYAQVPVTDAANTREAAEIRRLSEEIQRDTSVVKENTTKTLQAITGDRSQDASQFANLATGSGFSMAQAPDFSSIMSGNQSMFGGIGGEFQNNAAQLINGLNLIKGLVDQFKGGGSTANSKSYDEAVMTLTSMTALTDAANSAAKERTQSFVGAAGEIGKAKDLKGALEQNTQMVNQGNATTNEAVGALNNAVTLTTKEQVARIAAMSERIRAFSADGNGGSAQSQNTADQLKAFQDAQ